VQNLLYGNEFDFHEFQGRSPKAYLSIRVDFSEEPDISRVNKGPDKIHYKMLQNHVQEVTIHKTR